MHIGNVPVLATTNANEERVVDTWAVYTGVKLKCLCIQSYIL